MSPGSTPLRLTWFSCLSLANPACTGTAEIGTEPVLPIYAASNRCCLRQQGPSASCPQHLPKKGLQASVPSVCTSHFHSLLSSSPPPSGLHSFIREHQPCPAGPTLGAGEAAVSGAAPLPLGKALALRSAAQSPAAGNHPTSQPPSGTLRAEINIRVCVYLCVFFKCFK